MRSCGTEEMAVSHLIPIVWALIVLQVALKSTVAESVSSVDVIGVVYCDRCLEHTYTKNGVLLKGASVAIDCKDKDHDAPYRVVALTDESGSFKVRLSPSLHHSEAQLDCTAHLLSSSSSQCKVLGISMKKSSDFLHHSRDADHVIYTAGDFTFLPQAVPSFCSEAAIRIPSISGLPKPNLKLPSLPKPKLPSLPKPRLPSVHLPKLPYHLPLPKVPVRPHLPTIPSLLPKAPFSQLPTNAAIQSTSSSTSSPIALSNPLSKLPPLPRPMLKFPPIPKLTFPKPKFFPRLPKFPSLPKVTIPKVKFPSSPPSP